MMDEKPIRVRLDYATDMWSKAHPDCATTVRQCKNCGLFYKSSLGHQCVSIGKGWNSEKDTDTVCA